MECESDSIEVIKLINTDETNHVYRSVVVEIKEWLQKDWRVTILHVLRKANACVDFLDDEGARDGMFLCCMQDPPHDFLPLLQEDFIVTLFVRP